MRYIRRVYIISNVSNLPVLLPDHAHALENIDYSNPRILVRYEPERKATS